jgi:hypothetical protein
MDCVVKRNGARFWLPLLSCWMWMTGAAMAGDVTGWTVQRIEYSSNGARAGEYRMISPGQWVEYTSAGTEIRFRERSRDDWNVYLEDARRGVRLQLDLRSREVWYSDSDSRRRPLYQVWAMHDGGDSRHEGDVCYAAIQGRIAWDYEGNRYWQEANMAELCAGNENSVEPARCFQRVMHEGIDWGGGTRWEWTNAIALCQGARRANRRIDCFVELVDEGYDWEPAIQECAQGRRR